MSDIPPDPPPGPPPGPPLGPSDTSVATTSTARPAAHATTLVRSPFSYCLGDPLTVFYDTAMLTKRELTSLEYKNLYNEYQLEFKAALRREQEERIFREHPELARLSQSREQAEEEKRRTSSATLQRSLKMSASLPVLPTVPAHEASEPAGSGPSEGLAESLAGSSSAQGGTTQKGSDGRQTKPLLLRTRSAAVLKRPTSGFSMSRSEQASLAPSRSLRGLDILGILGGPLGEGLRRGTAGLADRTRSERLERPERPEGRPTLLPPPLPESGQEQVRKSVRLSDSLTVRGMPGQRRSEDVAQGEGIAEVSASPPPQREEASGDLREPESVGEAEQVLEPGGIFQNESQPMDIVEENDDGIEADPEQGADPEATSDSVPEPAPASSPGQGGYSAVCPPVVSSIPPTSPLSAASLTSPSNPSNRSSDPLSPDYFVKRSVRVVYDSDGDTPVSVLTRSRVLDPVAVQCHLESSLRELCAGPDALVSSTHPVVSRVFSVGGGSTSMSLPPSDLGGEVTEHVSSEIRDMDLDGEGVAEGYALRASVAPVQPCSEQEDEASEDHPPESTFLTGVAVPGAPSPASPPRTSESPRDYVYTDAEIVASMPFVRVPASAMRQEKGGTPIALSGRSTAACSSASLASPGSDGKRERFLQSVELLDDGPMDAHGSSWPGPSRSDSQDVQAPAKQPTPDLFLSGIAAEEADDALGYSHGQPAHPVAVPVLPATPSAKELRPIPLSAPVLVRDLHSLDSPLSLSLYPSVHPHTAHTVGDSPHVSSSAMHGHPPRLEDLVHRSMVSKSQVSTSLTDPVFQEIRHKLNPRARPHTASAKRTVYRPVKMRGMESSEGIGGGEDSANIDLAADSVSARSGKPRSAGSSIYDRQNRYSRASRPYSASTRGSGAFSEGFAGQMRGLSLSSPRPEAYLTELKDFPSASSSDDAQLRWTESESTHAFPEDRLADSQKFATDPSLVNDSPLRLPPSAKGVDPSVIRGGAAMRQSLRQELRPAPGIPSTPDRFGDDPFRLKAPPPVPCLAGTLALKPEAVLALSRSTRPRSCSVGKTRPSRTLNSEVGQRLRLPSAINLDAVRDVRSISCLYGQQ